MLHDARHAAPHHHFGSKWSRTGGMRRAPTDQICLDFLGGMTTILYLHGNDFWLFSSNHRVIILLERACLAREREESDEIFTDRSLQRHSVTSLS